MTPGTALDTQQYVHTKRFPQRWGIISGALFLMTLPLTLMLGVIRAFIGLQALVILCLMPKSLALRRHFVRLVLMLLGVYVNIKKVPGPSTASVIVSNHISVLDRLVLECTMPCVTLNVRDVPLLIRLIIGSLDLTPRQEAPPPTTVAKSHLDNSTVPIYIHPEQIMSNGQGVLKFASWAFSISSNVQPVSLNIKRYHLLEPVLSHTFSSPLGDLFWVLCSPAHWVDIEYLPEEQMSEKSPEERASHVQKLISEALEKPALSISCHDVAEYKKNIIKGQGRNEYDLETLVRQVVNTLPNIPEGEIRADLTRTRDVTQTIYNLVNTAPNTRAKKVPRAPSSSSSGGGFPKDPAARSSMLDVKKAELIADGRRKYIEKHGLPDKS